MLPVTRLAAAGLAPQVAASLSMGMTSISACDDCLRMALVSKGMPDTFHRVLVRYWDVARIGSVLQDTARLVSLLKAPATAPTEKRLAFALGASAHLGVNRQLYPGESGLTERMIYHDAALLQQFAGSMVKASSETMDDLLAAVDSRNYIRIHTFEPEAENVDSWLLKMVEWSEGKADFRQRYARALATPDASKVRKYVTAENFYDPQDEIIQLADALRRGDAESIGSIAAARSAARSQSLYARSLAAGYGNLVAAAELHTGKINARRFRKELMA